MREAERLCSCTDALQALGCLGSDKQQHVLTLKRHAQRRCIFEPVYFTIMGSGWKALGDAIFIKALKCERTLRITAIYSQCFF